VLPWLFRTSPGYGLALRGLTNEPKENAVALDAIVETDWSPYTFTMNWKLLRGEVPVRFEKGDVVCLVQPFALDLLEQFECSFEPVEAAPRELREGFDAFVNRRSANIAVAPQGQYESQRDYFAGRFPDGSPARYPAGTARPAECPAVDGTSSEALAEPSPRHRTSFELRPFTRRDGGK
jgi:hypothetical protein